MVCPSSSHFCSRRLCVRASFYSHFASWHFHAFYRCSAAVSINGRPTLSLPGSDGVGTVTSALARHTLTPRPPCTIDALSHASALRSFALNAANELNCNVFTLRAPRLARPRRSPLFRFYRWHLVDVNGCCNTSLNIIYFCLSFMAFRATYACLVNEQRFTSAICLLAN